MSSFSALTWAVGGCLTARPAEFVARDASCPTTDRYACWRAPKLATKPSLSMHTKVGLARGNADGVFPAMTGNQPGGLRMGRHSFRLNRYQSRSTVSTALRCYWRSTLSANPAITSASLPGASAFAAWPCPCSTTRSVCGNTRSSASSRSPRCAGRGRRPAAWWER